MRSTLVFLSTLFLQGLTGCAQQEGLAATEVLNEANCRGAEEGMRQVGYAEVAALKGATLIGATAPATTTAPELVLLTLSRGRQPTPGYRFELIDAVLEAGAARLDIRWHIPDPETQLAQIVTYPCMVVGLERGAFQIVRAIDQNDELIGEIRL